MTGSTSSNTAGLDLVPSKMDISELVGAMELVSGKSRLLLAVLLLRVGRMGTATRTFGWEGGFPGMGAAVLFVEFGDVDREAASAAAI